MKLDALLQKAFPYDTVKRYKYVIEITNKNHTTYLVIGDGGLIFRCGSDKDILKDQHNFYDKHKKNEIGKWYLPARTDIYTPKNRDMYLYYDMLVFRKKKLFNNAWPYYTNYNDYETFYTSYRKDQNNYVPGNCIYYKNITCVNKLVTLLKERIKYNEYVYVMVMLFRGGAYKDGYFMNDKEGVGYHVLGYMIDIINNF